VSWGQPEAATVLTPLLKPLLELLAARFGQQAGHHRQSMV
jgi:hypothetical protein